MLKWLLFGASRDDSKYCYYCQKEIPATAIKCPYCHSDQNSTIDDIHQYGCLGLPVIVLIIFGIISLIAIFFNS